jgi:CBS domain containing-hemolysin-like protein
MVEQSGKMLRKGQSIEFDGVVLQVDAGDARRIRRIKVMLPPPASDAEPDPPAS